MALMAALSLSKYTHVILVQSSINHTNHLASEQLGTLKGPHTSECTKEKGNKESLLLTTQGTHWCLDSSQTHHSEKN